MKKIFSLLLMALVSLPFYGQWTTAGYHIYNINSGNVGIGTSSPAYRLSVINTGNNGNWAQLGGAFVAGENDGSYPSLGYNIAGTGTSSFNYIGNDYASWIKFDMGRILFNIASYGSAGTAISPLTAMSIGSSGNIGMGTTGSTYRLSVINTGNYGNWAQLGGAMIAGENGGSYPSFGYNILGTGASTFQYLSNDYASWMKFDAGKIVFNVSTSGITGATISPTTAMTILSDGSIGMGTSSPSEKLSVNGNVKAKKVIVTQSGWPDYVFASGYKLPSLTDIDLFIRKNKRLPGIPPEKEVEQKDINIGENQVLLLRKIEELTLYVIELKKENIEQNKKIGLLSKVRKPK